MLSSITKLPNHTKEIVYGKYPDYNGDIEYLAPEVWAIDDDGDAICRIARCDTLNEAIDYASELSKQHGNLPIGYDDYSEDD